MDIKVLTRDNWTCCRNTYRAAHDYSIKMQVGAAKTDYLIVFIWENTSDHYGLPSNIW